MRKARLFGMSTVGVCALVVLGGCAQLDAFVERVAHALTPGDEAAREVAAKEPPEISADEISALTRFQTAAGPAPERHPAAAHIEDLGRQVIAAIGDTTMPEAERVRFFGELLARDLDIPIIARFVLGGHWRKSTRQQRQAYVRVFTDFVMKTYSVRLGGVGVTRFEVVKTRAAGKRDVVVRSRVSRAHAKPIRADWRVRRRQGRLRILDVSVEGVSMALMLRQEFSSVLRNSGGVEGLIETLKKRLAWTPTQGPA